jgi:hypothetical protein
MIQIGTALYNFYFNQKPLTLADRQAGIKPYPMKIQR